MRMRSVVAGLAAGTIANAIYMLTCVADARATTATLVAFHWLVVVVIHCLIALAFAGRRDNRLWCAAAFLLPVVTVSASELDSLFGLVGVSVAIIGGLGVAAVATLLMTRRVSPFWSAAAGSFAGSTIPMVHQIGWAREIESEILVGIALAVFLVAMLVAVFAGRPRGSLVPTLGFGAVRIAVFGAVGLGAFALTPTIGGIDDRLPNAKTAAGRPSVVLIVLDTVRADHLELYGYDRVTMPRLTEFARSQAVVAERAVANGPSSLPTHASLFTGLYPARHGAHKPFLGEPRKIVYGYRLHERIPTLATILARAGYWTVGISSNAGPLAPIFGLGQGFEVYHAVSNPRGKFLGHSPWASELVANRWVEKLYLALSAIHPAVREYFLGVPYRRADEINEEVFDVIDAAGDDPFFLFVNYMDAHSPYFPPGDYLELHPGRDPSLMASRFGRTLPFSAESQLSDTERAHYVALYDGELSYLDSQLDLLLRRLEQHPKWDEMLVIITSDHGEAIGEHGGLEHSNSLYDEITHVPMVVKPGRTTPGAPPPGTILTGLIESVDVFPLVLDHAGLPVPDDIDGRFWGTQRSHAFGWLYPSPPIAPEALRSVQDGLWKLVQSSSGVIQLYNLEFDPDELLDLSVAEGAVRESLLTVLERGAADDRRDESEPTPELSDQMRDELRALGYLE